MAPRSVRLLLSCGFLLIAAGCAGSLEVDYDYDPGADFSKLRTFGWLPRNPESGAQQLRVKRIQSAVTTQLQAKGLKPADNPDFLIGMQVSGRTTESGSVGVGASVGIPVGRGTVSVGGGRRKPIEKTEGTLILDFVSPADKSLLWHGSATGTVHPDATPEEQEQRINQAVGEMLQNFPPRGKK
jgi:hypothetical protein